MISILSQINRFKEQSNQFEVGKEFKIELPSNDNREQDSNSIISPVSKMLVGKEYKIQVKKYMTEPATATFDFHTKWNEGKPMPFVVMQGKVLKETRGMYQMELQGKAETTSVCMCCGRTLSNPISKLYGIGPECSSKAGIIRIETEEEAREKWNILVEQIGKVKWTGWVIKSAIKKWEEV